VQASVVGEVNRFIGTAEDQQLIAAAPDLRRTALYLLQRAERAEARVTELEAPGECNSIHKLRAQVADLQAAIERVRPVVDELAAAWDCGSPMMIRHLMERLGRAAYTSRVEDAAWLRSLLSTAPDPVHRPGHTDLMVAPESVPDLAPQPPPTLRETIARLEAEMSKPPAGPWRDVAGAARRRDLRGGVVAEVSPFGWRAYCVPGVGGADLAAYGTEWGEAGRRLADAAAVAAGWRLCDRA